MTTPVFGYSTQLAIDSAAIGTGSVRVDFQSESLALHEDFVDTNGLRGTRARSVERFRAGNRRVAGQVRLQPNSLDLSKIDNAGVGTNCLLQWIMGGTPSGSPTVTYPLADKLGTARNVMVARDDGTSGKVFTYSGCQVDRATFHARQAEPLELLLDVVGIDEAVGNAGTFPAIALDLTTKPFLFTDGAFSINSVTYNLPEFELVVDNSIDKERFFNSQTLTIAFAMDRHITFRTRLPYGDAVAAYNTGIGGVAVTATFTDGSAVLTLSLVKVVFPRRSPTVPGRQEVMLPMEGTALKSSTTLELVTTLNPGP